jgi:uridylate kinase
MALFFRRIAMKELLFKRIMLKISGEALAGPDRFGLNTDVINGVAEELAKINSMGVEIAMVVGAGNIWRGRSGIGMDRTTADHMGMLATAINALALQDALEHKGVQTRVQSAIEMRQMCEPYIRRRAVRHLEKKRIVIFACGTGNPYFSTDTAAALRSAEIDADCILLAKRVDGVYNKDPEKHGDAKMYNTLTYLDIINQGLAAMDSTATSLCMDNKIPIIVFGMNEPKNILRILEGEKIGTQIGL